MYGEFRCGWKGPVENLSKENYGFATFKSDDKAVKNYLRTMITDIFYFVERFVMISRS